MNNLEKLAIVKALEKEIKKLTDTKDPDSLRYQVDAEMYERYQELGARSYNVLLDGVKVGTYTVKVDERESTSEQVFTISDRKALRDWLSSQTKDELEDFVSTMLEEYAQYVYRVNGELPDGCTIEDVVTAGGTVWTGGLLKVDEEKVFAQIKLPHPIAGLLGGGNESE